MTRRQTFRIYLVLLVTAGMIAATSLSLLALRSSVTFYYSPSDILDPDAGFEIPDRPFRLGGLVKAGSVRRKGTALYFTITDTRHEIPAVYTGLPPDLFREEQGVVAQGTLDETGLFRAQTLLARHDENYMPPEVARSLEATADSETGNLHKTTSENQ